MSETETVKSVEDLRTKVQTLITASPPIVVEQVVTALVKVEIDRRAALLTDGLKRHADATTALSKFKADHIVFDDTGKVLSQGWSAKQKSEREKAQKVVDRLGTALDTAISSGDFKALEEALKGQQGKESNDS